VTILESLMKCVKCGLLVGIVSGLYWGAPAAAGAADEPSALAALAAEAVIASPSLEALAARERALRERAAAAGAWPDPVLGVEYSNAPLSSFAIADHPMSGVQLKVQQTLKTPGWSAQARQVGALSADAAALERDEAALSLSAAVRASWWSLTGSRLLEATTREHVAYVDELLAAALYRYEVGAAGQSVVLRLELLRARLADDLVEYQRSEVELEAALAGALARPPGARFETPAAVTPAPPPTERDWAALAADSRPVFAVKAARIAAAEAGAELARLDARIDPAIWAGYRVRTVETETDPGVDLVSVGVGVPIPLGSGRRARSEQAARLETAAAERAGLAAAEDAVAAEMAAVLARWTRAHQKADTYRETLIPAARAARDATLSDYTVGEAGFAALLEAEVVLLDLERTWIAAAVETHLQQARATALVGVTP